MKSAAVMVAIFMRIAQSDFIVDNRRTIFVGFIQQSGPPNIGPPSPSLQVRPNRTARLASDGLLLVVSWPSWFIY